jgi:uncharacterized phage protein (TIGR01671 family)
MNRQLKFRIWDKLKRNEQLLIDNLGKIFVIDEACGQANEADDQENYVIQQYTGLKDSKGVEIFEGDLVQYNQNSNYDGMNFEVVWSDASFGWVLKSKTGDYLTNQITPNGPRYNFLEVVGNVFENKELLKTNE